MTVSVYIDANIFISLFEALEDVQARIRGILSGLERAGALAVTSELALAECLVAPLRSETARLADLYRALLSTRPGLRVLPISRSRLELAARLRADRTALKLPDAIHLATATEEGCAFFLTDDRRLWTDLPGLVFLSSNEADAKRLLEGLTP